MVSSNKPAEGHEMKKCPKYARDCLTMPRQRKKKRLDVIGKSWRREENPPGRPDHRKLKNLTGEVHKSFTERGCLLQIGFRFVF